MSLPHRSAEWNSEWAKIENKSSANVFSNDFSRDLVRDFKCTKGRGQTINGKRTVSGDFHGLKRPLFNLDKLCNVYLRFD